MQYICIFLTFKGFLCQFWFAMKDRIKAVIAMSNLSETQFAKKLGITQSSINRVKRGATENCFKVINAILTEYKDISAEWLLRGNGDMMLSNNTNDKKINSLTDVIAMQQETIQNLIEKIKQLKNN